MTKFEFDAKVLEAVPLFSGLPRGDLEDIVRLGQKVSFDAGVDIVQSGDPGDGMYFLLEGRTEVDIGGRFHRLSHVATLCGCESSWSLKRKAWTLLRWAQPLRPDT